MEKKPGSRRDRKAAWAGIEPRSDESTWTGITVTCQREGHEPQRWKIRRDKDGDHVGEIWFTGRPDGTIPEQRDPAPGHQRLRFVCPVCRLDVVWTPQSAHRRFNALEARDLRTGEYPL